MPAQFFTTTPHVTKLCCERSSNSLSAAIRHGQPAATPSQALAKSGRPPMPGRADDIEPDGCGPHPWMISAEPDPSACLAQSPARSPAVATHTGGMKVSLHFLGKI